MAGLTEYIEQKAAKLLGVLLAKRRTVTFAESCTGGMLAAAFTAHAGASEALRRSFVTYCDAAKAEMLGVSAKALARYTAVSAAVAAQMAAGAKTKAGADIAVSVTGLAGPGGGTAAQPVGLVYIGCAAGDSVRVVRCIFPGSRKMVRQQAALVALRLALAAADAMPENEV